jgi:hypothetical protein
MYLAPLSAAAITAKHCDWQQMKRSDEVLENAAGLGDDSYQGRRPYDSVDLEGQGEAPVGFDGQLN